MKSEPLTSKSCKRICDHMNKDHADAVIAYTKHFGGIETFNNAQIINLSSKFMVLRVDDQIIKIKFDHQLQDCQDAHQTLVSMIKSIPIS